MKQRITSILVMALMALTVCAAGETADWYLYIWSDTSNSGGDAGQFVTTDTEGVFLLEGCSIAEEGVKFCVRNGAWSAMYGWDDEGGSVAAADTPVKLAVATGATGWLALPVGTYDVTWNANDLTITFTASSSTSAKADWFIYYWDDAANAGGDLGQFVTTDQEGVFLLKDLSVTNADGVKFCIHNAAWTAIYGWNWVEGTEGGSVTATATDVLLEVSTTASAWLGLPVGNYDVTWNANALTVRFDGESATGIKNNNRETTTNNRYFDLQGRRVAQPTKGMFIQGGKKFIRK